LPVLEKHAVPATIFVSSDVVDSNRGFWWDELDRLLLSRSRLPATLSITMAGGATHSWNTDGNTDRMQLRRAVNSLLRPLTVTQRETILGGLKTAIEGAPEPDPVCRPMTTQELRLVQDSELVELGAHTRSHPLLSSLSAEQQHAEIVGGRDRLQQILGDAVDTFAYPYGDFDTSAAQIVRAAGFDAVCTTQPGPVEAGSDLMRLPRFWVGNWNAQVFARQMEKFLAC
jgi:peptidoglycan/xylan/chitin deacetylase (PgdA/CDA1 family)